jgi:hypothetical protein
LASISLIVAASFWPLERWRERDLWMENVRRRQSYAPWVGVINGEFHTRECLFFIFSENGV